MWQANDQQQDLPHTYKHTSIHTHTRTQAGRPAEHVIYAYLMYFNGAHIYFSLLPWLPVDQQANAVCKQEVYRQ